MADKLYQVFKTNSLGHLTRHGSGRQRAQITVEMSLPENHTETLKFSFAKNSRTEVSLDQRFTTALPNHAAIFIRLWMKLTMIYAKPSTYLCSKNCLQNSTTS